MEKINRRSFLKLLGTGTVGTVVSIPLVEAIVKINASKGKALPVGSLEKEITFEAVWNPKPGLPILKRKVNRKYINIGKIDSLNMVRERFINDVTSLEDEYRRFEVSSLESGSVSIQLEPISIPRYWTKTYNDYNESWEILKKDFESLSKSTYQIEMKDSKITFEAYVTTMQLSNEVNKRGIEMRIDGDVTLELV